MLALKGAVLIYILENAFTILTATLVGLGFGVGYCLMADRARTRIIGLTKLVPLMLLAFVAQFWLASILAGALILAPAEADGWTMAIGSALVIWIGFVVPVLFVTHRFRGLSARVALIDCGHWLAVMIAQAIMLRSMGLSPPPA